MFSVIPSSLSIYDTRNTNNILLLKQSKTYLFSKFLFPFCGYWMEQTLAKYSQFRKFENLQKNSFEIHRTFFKQCFQLQLFQRSILITRLRVVDLNPFCEHNFKQSFHDSLNPICSCVNNTETWASFLLHCPNYSMKDQLSWISLKTSIGDLQINETLLCDDGHSNNITSTLIFNAR